MSLTSKSKSKSSPFSSSSSSSSSTQPSLHLSANFAGTQPYDHEVYLQLMAGGKKGEKTPNQVYRDEKVRKRITRALDPAISDPQGDPSPIDFECAEIQFRRDR